MPPAFVLSQDQTLKFIPDPLPLGTHTNTSQSGQTHIKGLQTFASARTSGDPTAAVRASLPSSPQSQSAIPRQATAPQKGRAYKPPVSPSQHLIHRRQTRSRD